MVVVVQAFSEGYERQQLEVGRVVLEALVAEGMAGAVDGGVQEQVDDRQRGERRETEADPMRRTRITPVSEKPRVPRRSKILSRRSKGRSAAYFSKVLSLFASRR